MKAEAYIYANWARSKTDEIQYYGWKKSNIWKAKKHVLVAKSSYESVGVVSCYGRGYCQKNGALSQAYV